MHVHILQHVPFEDIGSMAPWFKARDARLSYTRFFENPVLPDLAGIDLVIAMGGPMSVNDTPDLEWLVPEKQFIREAIEKGIPVAGICLGAQLIASALGARVYPNRLKEIGWLPVEATPRRADVFSFPDTCTVFHWHGETFDLPDGAVRLARSAACENQAFQIGRRVIGLQFHLETTPESARALVENCRNELIPGPCIQSEAQILAVPESTYARINTLMGDVLSYLLQTP